MLRYDIQISFFIDKEIRFRLDETAYQQRLTRSQLLRKIINEYTEQFEKKHGKLKNDAI